MAIDRSRVDREQALPGEGREGLVDALHDRGPRAGHLDLSNGEHRRLAGREVSADREPEQAEADQERAA